MTVFTEAALPGRIHVIGAGLIGTSVALAARRAGVQVSVEDDGIGFDVSKLRSHPYEVSGFGLFNISERLDHISGNIEIDSAPGDGTRVTLAVPIEKRKTR